MLIDVEVDDSNAATCPRNFCTCTSHDDYEKVFSERRVRSTIVESPKDPFAEKEDQNDNSNESETIQEASQPAEPETTEPIEEEKKTVNEDKGIKTETNRSTTDTSKNDQ